VKAGLAFRQYITDMMDSEVRQHSPEILELTHEIVENQRRLTSQLKPKYDFIVCGSGSSGSVVARRLAENPDISVLLLEAGGSENIANILIPSMWPTNLGTDREWGFMAEPNPHLNGRSQPFAMGKVLGGSSSINVMVWARGHKNDWDYFADEAADPAWNYQSVLQIYRRIENWQGTPDPHRRGTSGPVYVEPSENFNEVSDAALASAASVGVKVYESPNGAMMEGEGGAARTDTIIRNGRRQSIFRSYVLPYMDRPNLTVLTEALVLRVHVEGSRATGVEFLHQGKVHRIDAGNEIILSLGAINTPRVLMLSGIGDESELKQVGIPVTQHLPGVGKNFQDHTAFCCVWEYARPDLPSSFTSNFTVYWKSNPSVSSPDILQCEVNFPLVAPDNIISDPPKHGWAMFTGLAQPKSRGTIRLRTSDPSVSPQINANALSHPEDLQTARACVELCQAIGNANPLAPYLKREAVPGPLSNDFESFARNAAITFWHETGTAKMGHDVMSVVNNELRVYGIQGLRIADGSIMPRITSGNTMAPCVVIGERAAEILRRDYR
jgi:choline dehydrogenase-like flavoprotein